MELEEAIKILEDENQVILDFTTGKVDEKWKIAYKTLIQIAKNSIPKQIVKEKLEYIEDYFDRLNGPDEDIEYIKDIKKELLEGK